MKQLHSVVVGMARCSMASGIKEGAFTNSSAITTPSSAAASGLASLYLSSSTFLDWELSCPEFQ